MVVVDHQDVIEEVDDSFAQLVDRLPESLPGLVFYQILYPEDQSSERALFAEMMEGKRVHYRRRVRLMCGRAVIWAQMSVARIPSVAGGSRIVRAIQEASRLGELVEFQETERKMLSAELHDGLAQEIATLWIYLQTGRRQLEPTKILVDRCLTVVDKMNSELRQKMKDLRSPILEGELLSEAIEGLGFNFARSNDIEVQVLVPSDINLADHTVSLLVYRVVQEALRNVANHAGAKSCEVRIEKQGDKLSGIIADNGCGFDSIQTVAKGRLGITGMRDRCQIVGGHLSVQSAPGVGTTVRFEVPYGARGGSAAGG